MVSLVAESLSEPCVSVFNTSLVKVHRRLLSIFCQLRKHLNTGRKVNSSTGLRKLETSIQILPVIMKGLICIPLDNRAVLKSVAASSVVPSRSQADQRTGSAENKPSNVGVLARGAAGSGSLCSHT